MLAGAPTWDLPRRRGPAAVGASTRLELAFDVVAALGDDSLAEFGGEIGGACDAVETALATARDSRRGPRAARRTAPATVTAEFEAHAWADTGQLPPAELAQVLDTYAQRVITPRGSSAVCGLELITASVTPSSGTSEASAVLGQTGQARAQSQIARQTLLQKPSGGQSHLSWRCGTAGPVALPTGDGVSWRASCRSPFVRCFAARRGASRPLRGGHYAVILGARQPRVALARSRRCCSLPRSSSAGQCLQLLFLDHSLRPQSEKCDGLSLYFLPPRLADVTRIRRARLCQSPCVWGRRYGW